MCDHCLAIIKFLDKHYKLSCNINELLREIFITHTIEKGLTSFIYKYLLKIGKKKMNKSREKAATDKTFCRNRKGNDPSDP